MCVLKLGCWQGALDEMVTGVGCTIVIAHRLSTVKKCDRILVMHKVSVRVRVCDRVCVCVCVRACVHVCVFEFVCRCV